MNLFCDVYLCFYPELVQGMCHHHAAICPQCGERPCNGLVPEPMCNVCINAFAPWNDDGDEGN